MTKAEFRVAGTNQDATSSRRCDLSQDPIYDIWDTMGVTMGYYGHVQLFLFVAQDRFYSPKTSKRGHPTLKLLSHI